MNLFDLYLFAENQNIDVFLFDMDKAESIAIRMPDGSKAIAVDPSNVRSFADLRWKLAHETGHCETESFYVEGTPLDERGRHERRADRWAIKNSITFENLCDAVHRGICEAWELAEHFDLPEEAIRKAVDYYTGSCGLSFT